MTQMIPNKMQKGALQNPGLRQSSRDSDKPSHRSHRSHASQSQYPAGYNNGNSGQSVNDSINLAQHVDAKPRNQGQYAVVRNPLSDVSGGGNKVKRTHNS